MNLFTILPVSTNDSSLPQLNAADITTFGAAEYGATGHWLLGGGAGSLTGITSAKSQLQAGTVAPIWLDNYVTLNGYQAGLESPSADTVSGLDSFCIVFKTQSSLASDVVMGNATTTAGDGGFFLALNASGELYITARGTFDNKTLATGLSTDTWYFVAVSRDFSGSAKNLTYKVSEVSSGLQVGTGTYIPSTSNVACGNLQFNNAARPIDYAEFITYNRVISESEMNSIYLRSKDRMLSKGITLA